jgi:predicted phosphoadenosine phosphosulfate sulfurtransferase
MRKIPAALNVQFDALLVKKKIPQRFHSHYLKWLRYYLDFHQKNGFSESNPQSQPDFIRKLKEKRQTDAQQKQASVLLRSDMSYGRRVRLIA